MWCNGRHAASPVDAGAPVACDEADLVLTARVGQCLDMAPHDQQPLDDKVEEGLNRA
jgi:hypothetical protein